jgi:hydroxyacylglutathione hydrolase
MKIRDDLYAFSWSNPTANNCNTYFINGEKKVLVDPGHDHLFQHVLDRLADLSLSPEDIDLIIITHGHPDHMEGIRRFRDTRALIAIHALEMDFIRGVAAHYGEALGLQRFEPQILLQEGELKVGTLHFRVIHTPGHSPGSICLYWPRERALFAGDLIFSQGVGRTDLPGGDGEELKESIKKVSELDVEVLLPGHGEVISGRELVQANFSAIERVWFAYL